MKKPISPCLTCTERRSECHGFCSKYQEYAKENTEYREWLRDKRVDEYVPRTIGAHGGKNYG